jgi:hypothetical protein
LADSEAGFGILIIGSKNEKSRLQGGFCIEEARLGRSNSQCDIAPALGARFRVLTLVIDSIASPTQLICPESTAPLAYASESMTSVSDSMTSVSN